MKVTPEKPAGRRWAGPVGTSVHTCSRAQEEALSSRFHPQEYQLEGWALYCHPRQLLRSSLVPARAHHSFARLLALRGTERPLGPALHRPWGSTRE